MSHRNFYPYARYREKDLTTLEEVDVDVLKALFKEFAINQNMHGWIKPCVWEYYVFKRLSEKYDTTKGLGSDFHKVRNSLYNLIDILTEDKIIDKINGNGWRYPLYKCSIKNLWILSNYKFSYAIFSS